MQAAEARAPEPNLGAGFFVRTASEAPMAQKSDSDAMAEKIVRKEKNETGCRQSLAPYAR